MNCTRNTRRIKTVCDYPLLVGVLLKRIAERNERRERWKNRFQLRKFRPRIWGARQ